MGRVTLSHRGRLPTGNVTSLSWTDATQSISESGWHCVYRWPAAGDGLIANLIDAYYFVLRIQIPTVREFNQPPKANSAFHPSGVGKWVPASTGKAKAGMVHSNSGWTRGAQVKLWDPLRTRAISESLSGVFTTRRYKSTFTFTFTFNHETVATVDVIALRCQPQIYIYVPDAVPPIHAESSHVATDKDPSK